MNIFTLMQIATHLSKCKKAPENVKREFSNNLKQKAVNKQMLDSAKKSTSSFLSQVASSSLGRRSAQKEFPIVKAFSNNNAILKTVHSKIALFFATAGMPSLQVENPAFVDLLEFVSKAPFDSRNRFVGPSRKELNEEFNLLNEVLLDSALVPLKQHVKDGIGLQISYDGWGRKMNLNLNNMVVNDVMCGNFDNK